MTDQTTELIAQGRRFDAAGTPGPWAIDRDEQIVWQRVSTDREMDVFIAAPECIRDAELIVWARNNLPVLLDKLEKLQRGGKALGDIVRRLQDAALDATGLHHLIGADGDGDWQAVWENVADLGAEAEHRRVALIDARARVNELKTERDEARELAVKRGLQRSGAEARIDELEADLPEIDRLRDRVRELEAWKTNAEVTLTEDKRYIDEANSGKLVQRLAAERDEARDEAERLSNLYEQLERSTQEAFVRIAAKQKRDAQRIAELESGLK